MAVGFDQGFDRGKKTGVRLDGKFAQGGSGELAEREFVRGL